MGVKPTEVISRLDIQVTYPEQMQIGHRVKVQVFVTNKADFDVHDLIVSGSLVPEQASALVIPAQSLGTLPAYGSKTATFVMVALLSAKNGYGIFPF